MRTTLFDVLAARGISRRWLAQQIGLNESILSKVAKGKRTLGPEYRKAIARVLQLPESVLFFEDDVREGTDGVRQAS